MTPTTLRAAADARLTRNQLAAAAGVTIDQLMRTPP